MPTKRCSWGRCNSDSRYSGKPHMQGVQFFPFPKPWIDLENCRKWIRACGRPHEQLNEKKIAGHHYVCSKHFVDGRPTKEYPYPNAADPLAGIRTERCRPAPRKRVSTSTPRKELDKIPRLDTQQRSVQDLATSAEESVQLCSAMVHAETSVNQDDQCDGLNNKSTQTEVSTCVDDFDIQCNSCGNQIKLTPQQRKVLRRKGFINMIKESDASCFQYTGIPTVRLLQALFDWLKPATKSMKLWDGKKKLYTGGKSRGRRRKALSLFDEFILTLVRIRRGYDVNHLAFQFGITTSHVGRVVPAWINFLAKCLKPLIKWPSKEDVKGNLPNSFREFPSTRVIIDCTEIYVEKAFRPSTQRSTWSNYKHSNTFKLLVGIMPAGAITFVSKLYSGSISDQAIVEKSGILCKLEEGDDVMADRGFNIRHLLLPKGATLNIPSFTHGKQLSTRAVKRSRKIARVRIHVERAIRRMKTFRILSGVIPIRLRFQLDQIVTIVAVLCNLQDRLA